jgi:hypothetical protein
MATKYGIKLVYNMNGNPATLDAMRSTPSTSPLYNASLATWATQYESYLDQHSWEGTDPVRIKIEYDAGSDTQTVTYLIEGATASDVEQLQNMHVWLGLSGDISQAAEWRKSYRESVGIELASKEVVTFEV